MEYIHVKEETLPKILVVGNVLYVEDETLQTVSKLL